MKVLAFSILVCGTSLVTGMLTIALSSAGSPALVILLFPALAVAVLIVLHPLLGLAALISLSQLDAVANIISRFLPVSTYILLTGAVLLGIALDYRRRAHGITLGPEIPALRYAMLFVLWGLIATLYASPRTVAVAEWNPLFGAIILTYFIVYLADTREKLFFLMLVHVGSSLFQALVLAYDTVTGTALLGSTAVATDLSQFEGHIRSAGASDRDPMNAAAVLVTGTTMALVLFLRYGRWRWLTGLTFIVGSGGAVLSLTRSAGIILGFSVFWLIWLYRRHRRFPAFIIVGSLIVLIALQLVPEEYWERAAGLLNPSQERSLDIRLAHNVVGWELLKDNWLTGIGPGTFPYHFLSDEFRYVEGRYMYPEALHNSYLRVAVEYGVIGFLTWMAFIGSSLRALRPAFQPSMESELRVAALAILIPTVGFLLFLIIASPYAHRITWILPGFAIAAGRIALLNQRRIT